VAGGFGAAYLLFLREPRLPVAPAATATPPAPGVSEAEEGTADPIAGTEESNAEPTAQAVAESPTASPDADQGAPATPEPTVEPTPEPTSDAGAEQPPAGGASDTPEPGGEQPGLPSPAAVADEFVRATLGTVPDAAVDYDRARALMTVAYAAEFDSPEFVPLTYGIQEGPTDYEIAAEELSDANASVTVLGYWGTDLGREWRFTLQEEAGLWRVADIEVVDAAEQGEGGGAQSPFWQLTPAVEEFTVYPNGGWKLVVAFDPPAEDIGADFRIAYYREDDGSLVYDQESSGVIEAGRTRLTLDSDWTGYDLSAMGFRPGNHQVVATIDGVELASGELLVE
jgi:hypothetical protein